MRLRRFVIALAVMLLAGSGSFLMKASAIGAGPLAYGQDRDDWATPPGELTEVERQGFHDGVEGARKDVENHRRPDVNNRDEYRHPHVASRDRRAYRTGFRRGYEAAMSHLLGGERDRH